MRGRKAKAGRNAELVSRYEAGESSNDLAARFGLSKQRVCRLLAEHGVARRGPRGRRKGVPGEEGRRRG